MLSKGLRSLFSQQPSLSGHRLIILRDKSHSFALRFRSCTYSGNVSLGGATPHAVLIEAARGLTRAIETGNHPAAHVDDLASPIDSEAGARVVNHGRRPGSIERRCLNLVL